MLGKYRILEEVGRGGFGIVYRAEDTALGNREVALKVLHPQLVVDPASVRLFAQEAGTAARLKHRHIVTIYEADAYQDRRYIAMEYLPGPSLAALLAREGPQPVDRVAGWLEQAASALDHAHGRGVVHRDLKPSNLLLDAEGGVVVTDFGLARATEASGGVSSSRDGGIMTGTARYMAPEQARWGEATAASDVYSLGVVAYELLTGHTPFERGDAFAIALQQINDPPPPLRQLRPELPEGVEQAVLKALSKAPEDRYPTAGALAAALGKAWQTSQAQRQHEAVLAEHCARLQALEEAEDWAGAAAEAEWIEAEAPGYRGVAGRLAVARERLQRLGEADRREREERERRQRELEQREQKAALLYDTLLARRTAGDWASVLDLAAQIAAIAPAYRDVQEHRAWAEKRRAAEEARRQREHRERDQARRQRLLLVARRAASAAAIVLGLSALGLLCWWGATRIADSLHARATALAVQQATTLAMVTPTPVPDSPTPVPTPSPSPRPATRTPAISPTARTATPPPTASSTATAVPGSLWGPLLRAYVDYGCARGWAEGAQGTAAIDLTGTDGGTWGVTLTRDDCIVSDGAPQAPSAVLRMSTADLNAILTGEASLDALRSQGRVELTGTNEALKAALLEIASVISSPVGTPAVVTKWITTTPRPKSTATRAPARTTTPAMLFAAPRPASPLDGDSFDEYGSPCLSWSGVGALPADAYYAVTLSYRHGSATWYDEAPWLKNTGWCAAEHRYLLDLSTDGAFRWSVQVLRNPQRSPDNRPAGDALSPPGEWRTFYWKRSGPEVLTPTPIHVDVPRATGL